MYKWIILCFTILLMENSFGQDETWTDVGRILQRLWTDCVHSELFQSNAVDCLKRKSLLALDRVLKADVIPVYDGVDLVRYGNNTNYSPSTTEEEKITNRDADLDWHSLVLLRLATVLNTHVLRVSITKREDNSTSHYTEGRYRRRHHHHMMPIMLFGSLAMAMVLIPMGFKFLAVLGGKALLLAKMALLLASIQGLKKIATSNVNYGLYHAPGLVGWHDRHSNFEYGVNPYEEVQPDVQLSYGLNG